MSSAAFEGRTCPLGAIGHPKDGVRGRLQIVYGLLTSPGGIPVAIEVFKGNTGDPATVAAQVTKVRDRFRITKAVLVGDWGMLTDLALPGFRLVSTPTALQRQAFELLGVSHRLGSRSQHPARQSRNLR